MATCCAQHILLFLSELSCFSFSEIHPRCQTVLQSYGGNAEIGTGFFFFF